MFIYMKDTIRVTFNIVLYMYKNNSKQKGVEALYRHLHVRKDALMFLVLLRCSTHCHCYLIVLILTLQNLSIEICVQNFFLFIFTLKLL